jgi:hypothetical protein
VKPPLARKRLAEPSVVLEALKYGGLLLSGSCKPVSVEITDWADDQEHFRNLAMFGSRFFLTTKKELADVLVYRHLAVATSVCRAVNAAAEDTSWHALNDLYLSSPACAAGGRCMLDVCSWRDMRDLRYHVELVGTRNRRLWIYMP